MAQDEPSKGNPGVKEYSIPKEVQDLGFDMLAVPKGAVKTKKKKKGKKKKQKTNRAHFNQSSIGDPIRQESNKEERPRPDKFINTLSPINCALKSLPDVFKLRFAVCQSRLRCQVATETLLLA